MRCLHHADVKNLLMIDMMAVGLGLNDDVPFFFELQKSPDSLFSIKVRLHSCTVRVCASALIGVKSEPSEVRSNIDRK